MTSADHAPDAGSGAASIEAIEVVGVRLVGAFVLTWGVIDSVYLVARFFIASYPDDLAYIASVLAEACIGWLIAIRAPRIARWLRARTRVGSLA